MNEMEHISKVTRVVVVEWKGEWTQLKLQTLKERNRIS